ncbi:cytidylate kinase family protein [Corynebacterium frankenforstense]|uniref:cytidylate kinase family protein n=1 Tax=Corynebacterium frankenforstense TaxID=1230998 RepID=UPI001FE29636|nr:cytidylate kinase family protein [Corynebacterium frankenforstense]
MTTTKPSPGLATGQMKNRRVISYALGDAANNLSFLMTSMFLMVYMTEIAGVAAGVAGAIYGITKIWAGIADLIAGQTVDRFDTRFGRLRPWVLFGSLPLAIVFVLLFSVPAGLGATATVAWIFLFDALFQLAYSFVNIPYGSLSAAMTQNPVDRSKLSGARAIAGAVTGVALSFVVAPQFDDTTGDGIRLKFTLTCIGLAALAIGFYFICFLNCKEEVPKPTGKISFRETFKMIRQNRPLIVLCLVALFLLASLFTMNAVGMYFATYVLGNSAYYTWLMLAQTVGTVLAASLTATLTARIGKRNGYMLMGAFAVLGYVTIFFVPEGGLLMAVAGWFLFGIGNGGTNALMFSMQADTVDYGEWRTGIRAEGGSYSVLSFIRKCGQGIGGWAGAAIIGAFGYVAKAPEQSAEALQGIRVATGLVPAVLAIIAILVALFYKLNSEEHARIVSELNERRTQDAVASSKGVSGDAVKTAAPGNRSTLLSRLDQPHPPIVTMFGLRGSAATDIAPRLADRLGVKYIPQAFSSDELAEAGEEVALLTDSGISRWMRKVSLTGSDLSQASNLAANRKIANDNTYTVLKSVDGGGVIMGRNSALVLSRVVGALHVRIVSPLEKRIDRVVRVTGLDRAAAKRQCRTEDRMRAEMANALYQWDPNDDEYYDLVLNSGQLSRSQIIELIAETYRAKFPGYVSQKMIEEDQSAGKA